MTEASIYQFNWVDVIAVTLLIRTGYIGFQLGLAAELIKLVGLTMGFFVGFRIYQGWGDVIARNSFLSIEWAAALALTILVVVVYLAVTRILRFFGNLVEVNFQDRLSQAGGLFAGLFRGVLMMSVILVVGLQLPSPYLQASIQEHSLSGHRISRMAPGIYDGLCALPGRVQEAL